MIDLHIHTTASDGEFSPEEIIKMSADKGVKTIAITDHDTIAGVDRAIKEGRKQNIEVIPGVELDAFVETGKMHILGYYIDYKDSHFVNEMHRIKKERDLRNNSFIKAFNNQNINITIEDVKKYAIGEIVGKPHFARALLDKGYITERDEAFTKYFNEYPLNEIKRASLTPKQAIELIKSAGGTVVLAHPVSLKLNDELLEEKIRELKSYGLDGIECYNKIHTQEDIIKLKEVANKLDLLITAGSDFHGPISTKDVEIGKGKNNNMKDITSLNIVEKLKEHTNRT